MLWLVAFLSSWLVVIHPVNNIFWCTIDRITLSVMHKWSLLRGWHCQQCLVMHYRVTLSITVETAVLTGSACHLPPPKISSYRHVLLLFNHMVACVYDFVLKDSPLDIWKKSVATKVRKKFCWKCGHKKKLSAELMTNLLTRVNKFCHVDNYSF